MNKSLIIKANCPHCNQIAQEKSRLKLKQKDGSISILIRLECGHLISEHTLSNGSINYADLSSSDGKSLMPYQITGVKFVEESGANCLIADEQGLGKTIQSLAVLSLHQKTLTPALIVTKTSIKQQWVYEIMRWTANNKVQVINSSKDIALPGFDFYVVTYDLLKSESIFSLIELKTLILDECQAIKNHLAGRAKAVFNIRESHKIQHIIGLSGTPIKNNAGEYFTILNLLRPNLFHEYRSFLRTYCNAFDSFYGPKVGGLKNQKHFAEITKDFIIRRTKDEVLPDLPKLSRNFYHCSMESSFGQAYAKAYKDLEEMFYNDDSTENTANQLAVINRMRQITGISKVENCVDFTVDFLLSCERKLVIFTHHNDVRTLLQSKLNTWLEDGALSPVLMLTSDLNSEQRSSVIESFKSGNSRILIASTLSSGEGLNLQFCSDAIMLERQWNPANEEQAEARFHRFGQINPVTVTYFIATETIDDWFTQLVEEKRKIIANALDGKEITTTWDGNSLMKELIQTTVMKGLKRWSL